MLKVEIHLEISVPSDYLDVNQIVALSQEVQAQVGPALVAHCLETVQDLELARVLGPRWTDAPQDEAPWVCPQCRSRQGFSRRGSRPRTLRKTSVGCVPFNLRQVTCHTDFPGGIVTGKYSKQMQALGRFQCPITGRFPTKSRAGAYTLGYPRWQCHQEYLPICKPQKALREIGVSSV
jgi:hypothetical protein